MTQTGSRIASFLLLGLGLAMGALWLGDATSAVSGAVDLTGAVAPGQWMAWTWAGAVFFAVIAALLVIMTVWQALAPESPRRGVLGILTTPGDRLFISLLGSAFIHLGWLAAFGGPLWGALAVSLLYAAAVFRWV